MPSHGRPLHEADFVELFGDLDGVVWLVLCVDDVPAEAIPSLAFVAIGVVGPVQVRNQSRRRLEPEPQCPRDRNRLSPRRCAPTRPTRAAGDALRRPCGR